MNRVLLVLPFLGFACGQNREAPTSDPQDTATPTSTPSPSGATAPEVADRPADTKTDCEQFGFELDDPTEKTEEPPNQDDPVAHVGHDQNLTLKFTCGDEERIEDIDTLGFDCHGASCGCVFTIDRAGTVKTDDPSECDLSSDAETSAFVKGKDTPDVLASWAVITAVERAHIAQVQRYSVRSVEAGFDVVRLTSGTEETKVVFKHR